MFSALHSKRKGRPFHAARLRAHLKDGRAVGRDPGAGAVFHLKANSILTLLHCLDRSIAKLSSLSFSTKLDNFVIVGL